jgi:hypothetical protein
MSFVLFCSVLKLQCIDASCHHAFYCVIIINPMVHMYFVGKGKGFSKLHGQEIVTFLDLWLL